MARPARSSGKNLFVQIAASAAFRGEEHFLYGLTEDGDVYAWSHDRNCWRLMGSKRQDPNEDPF